MEDRCLYMAEVDVDDGIVRVDKFVSPGKGLTTILGGVVIDVGISDMVVESVTSEPGPEDNGILTVLNFEVNADKLPRQDDAAGPGSDVDAGPVGVLLELLRADKVVRPAAGSSTVEVGRDG